MYDYRPRLVHSSNEKTEMTTKVGCMMKSFTLIVLLVYPLLELLWVLLAVDRLLSLLIPSTYYKWSNHHSYVAAGGALVISLIHVIVGVVMTVASGPASINTIFSFSS